MELLSRQKGKPYLTGVLNQFLDTATGGNVVAEFAISQNRWRLVCKACRQTLTFTEVYDLEEKYTKEGRLDAGVQAFAKDHVHKPVPQYQPIANTVMFNVNPAYTGYGQVPKIGQGAAFTPPLTATATEYLAKEKEFYAHREMLKKEKVEEQKAQLQAELNVQKVKHMQLIAAIKEQTARVEALEKKTPPVKIIPPRKVEGRKFR